MRPEQQQRKSAVLRDEGSKLLLNLALLAAMVFIAYVVTKAFGLL
jgi:hypothetical protein